MSILATNVFDALGAPVEWGLIALEKAFGGFAPTRLIGALGLSIITVTLVIRAALFPVFGWQLRTMARVQAEQRTVAPQLKQLRQRYRKQPQKLSEEMQKLYHEHGINPWSSCLGCLPLLVQFPVLVALYNGIRLATGSIHQNLGFLWIPDVSQTLKDACCGSSGVPGLILKPHLVIIPALAILATYVQARMMTPPVQPGMSEAERKTADATRMMVYFGPVVVGFLSYSFYQGITLYWLTQSVFMIAQQYYVRGWGSMPVPAWLPGANRVTPLSIRPPGGAAPPARPAAATGGRTAARAGSGRLARFGSRPNGPAPRRGGSSEGGGPSAADTRVAGNGSARQAERAASRPRPAGRPRGGSRRKRRR